MTWQWTAPSSVLLATALLALSVASALLRRRMVPGASVLGMAMLSGAWWSLAACLEATAVPLGAKVLFSTLEYVGSGNMATLFLVFALRYTGRIARPFGSRLALLWALPVVAVSVAATNELHHQLWVGFSEGPAGSNSVIYHHGPAFFGILVLIYAYTSIAAYVLVTATVGASAVQRRQSATILIAIAFPVIGSALYALGVTPAPGLNLSPLSFVATGATLAIGVIPLRLFNLVPVAREALLQAMSDAVLVLDSAQRVVDFNPAAVRLLGLRSDSIGSEASRGLTLGPRLAPFIVPDRESHIELTVSENPLLHLDVRVTPLRRKAGQAAGALIVARDISARLRAERLLQDAHERLQGQLREIERLQAELREQAIRDELTGLFTRRYLGEELPRIIERASIDRAPVSVIMFDIDHFKLANDAHGHRTGDALLVALAKLLARSSRPGDIASRLGGDEFVLVLPGTPLEVAEQRAEDIRRDFRRAPIPEHGLTERPTVSAGVAEFPTHGQTWQDLLHAADETLYRAKNAGRDRTRSAVSDAIGQNPSRPRA
ncbi:MAG: hypothetical protein BIP78_0985 [Candidatus Bipolaricaulis sibiricus]|uniref:Uncharacterized protein n=1 Tax=Bipolaricaulis sibiricus TaxID=2501609 RepID=A0A410FUX1_BIPS1|nr:MAG: hypothetical protein BIP78_0985 [Candidatus Bipolaricaulis sibiricus]